ncbi:DNA modification system-associated small protein [uncultured Desulfobacter sp.]|uniref:DNA modification system-associated small protein n=1 Tax=uncultured Desulfobacter sp. TaxID=240139 RepID=UPI002AAAE41D|nr:DNA modification system-associated small protein [uncultured Desulfobacter sp.]
MINLSKQDKDLLEELCIQHDVSVEKVVKLLLTVREYEFKERRTGIYAALKKIVLEKKGS